jgi:hypothetical protein
LRHAEKQEKTEKTAKKGKKGVSLTYRPKGPNEREKMNYYLELALPLLGTIQIPISLVLGAVAFTFSMAAFIGLLIATELDNRNAAKK